MFNSSKKILTFLAKGIGWAVLLCAFLYSSSFISTHFKAWVAGNGDLTHMLMAVALAAAWGIGYFIYDKYVADDDDQDEDYA